MWAAALVERQAATLGNRLFTLAECDLRGAVIPAYIRSRIEFDLSRELESVAPSRVVRLNPGRAALLSFFSALALYALIFSLAPQVVRDEFRRLVLFDRSEKNTRNVSAPSQTFAAQNGDGVEQLRVVLTPPRYTQRSDIVQLNDGNIAALAGTRADFHVKAGREISAALLSVGGAPPVEMEREGELSYHGSFILNEDSTCKISLIGLAQPGWKWEAVYSIRAVKDNPPEVRITRPASDLLLTAENRPASLSVDIAAKDDYGVALLKLKYIKTTGEGDASRFENGEINISPAGESAEGQTRGAVRLDLASIGVEPGTSIVFHAEAMDRNNVTGPGVGYSESIIVQVAGPEPVKISLDDIRPDEALKYLTSERMILIKTEKLNRQRGKLPENDFNSRSQEIAAEQRRFRESFSQFAEIEPASEPAEGNDSQPPPVDESALAKLREGGAQGIPPVASEHAREIIYALRAMWRAEGALGSADTGGAMEFEKEAIVHLKAAQRGARYFTHVVAVSKPVDLKRRYMGALDGIRSRLERVARKEESAFDKRLRGCLALVYDAARILAQMKMEDADSRQKIEAARQKVDRAGEELLSIRGEGANLIIDSASKLKLITRMLDAPASSQAQNTFGMLVQVASEMSAALGRDEGAGIVSLPESLSPAVRAGAARYFKLLANP